MAKQKTVFISGVSSGFGKALVLKLNAQGWRVAGVGRNKKKLALLKEELVGNTDPIIEACDITKEKDLQIFVSKVLKKFKYIDVLINNAGIGLFKNLVDTSSKERLKVMDTNILAAMTLTQKILPSMIKAGSGHIINIASVAGKRSWKRLTAYSASKFALMGFSTALRRELKFEKQNIKVTQICPPASKSDFFVNAGYTNYEADHPGASLPTSDTIADCIIEAIRHQPREMVITSRARILDRMASLAPGFTEWFEDSLKKFGIG